MTVVIIIVVVIALVNVAGTVNLFNRVNELEEQLEKANKKERNDVMFLADLHDELTKEHNTVVDAINRMQKDFSRQCTYTEHLNRTMKHELEEHKRFVYNTLFHEEKANNELATNSPLGLDVETETETEETKE